MSWNHEYIQLEDLELHYVREGDGFPLVLVHGWPEYWRVWRKNIPILKESFDLIVPDLAGFGDSDVPTVPATEGYGIGDHVDDVLALTEALDIDEFGFVSHDLGAYAGQRLARVHHESVRGLFFFDCPYPGIGKRWRDPDAFDEEDREAWFETFSDSETLQGGFYWYVAADEARKRLMRDGAPSLEPIEVPTRFLWGERDPIVKSEWSDRLDEYFADFTLDTVPDAGHYVHYERPNLTNEEVASFFTDLL